jgi:hypothetical protein
MGLWVAGRVFLGPSDKLMLKVKEVPVVRLFHVMVVSRIVRLGRFSPVSAGKVLHDEIVFMLHKGSK